MSALPLVAGSLLRGRSMGSSSLSTAFIAFPVAAAEILRRGAAISLEVARPSAARPRSDEESLFGVSIFRRPVACELSLPASALSAVATILLGGVVLLGASAATVRLAAAGDGTSGFHRGLDCGNSPSELEADLGKPVAGKAPP
eukprot:CAMPEP_0180744668 /NCGR_PEP_ID=MMETSP1038_2-20121128/28090_1 /TAXON_ID=632150 /ORGANISM="Azadinium spinosum, Strain 3D9" /LENGTH=143 /DNA_ID=CAMNT_0022778139 /DNA_START=404 /DNA_END=831 /DNA_ORIENTATION=+